MEMTAPPMTTREEMAVLQALAHPNRLAIVRLLVAHSPDMSVEELTAHLAVKQPTTSFHLRILRAAGLVEMRRQGLHSLYRVCPAALRGMVARLAELLADEEARRA